MFLRAINLIVLICKGADTKLPVIYSFQERDETGVNFSFRKYLNYSAPNSETEIVSLEAKGL